MPTLEVPAAAFERAQDPFVRLAGLVPAGEAAQPLLEQIQIVNLAEPGLLRAHPVELRRRGRG